MRRSGAAAAAVLAVVGLSALAANGSPMSGGATAVHPLKTVSFQLPQKRAKKPDPWPQWNYDAAATSYNAAEHTLRPATVGKLIKKWTIPAYSGDRAATPPVAVRAGTLYEANPKHIRAYSISTGRHLRSYSVNRKGTAIVAPVLDGHRMITTIGPDLAAIDLSTGKVDWEVPEAHTSTLSNQWTCLTLSGSTVFAILQTETFTPTYSSTDQLEAFSASTGHHLWSATDEYGPIAVGGGMVYALASGVVIETRPRDEPDVDVEVNALNATTGALSWEFTMPGDPYPSGIAYTDSSVLVTGDTNDTAASDIYALNASTGTVRWSHAEPLAAGANGSNGAFIVTDGKRVVYYNSDPGKLVALSVANGHVVWRRAADDFFDHVVGADGVLYAESMNQHLRAFRLSDGKTLWTAHAKGLGPVLVADGRLVGDDKTHYIAYGRR